MVRVEFRFAELAPYEAAHVEEFAELIWEVAGGGPCDDVLPEGVGLRVKG